MKTQSFISFGVLLILVIVSCSKSESPDNNNNTNTVPNVTTSSITEIRSYSARTNVVINSNGGLPVSISGICISTLPHPDINNTANVVPHYSAFHYDFSNLSPNTTYYVRAYAKNDVGVGYGNELTFSTKPTSIALGEDYAGGTVFYIDGSGLHGLAAAPMDIDVTRPWDNGTGNLTIFTTSPGINTGKTNTTTILNILGPTGDYAALRCENLVVNGFNDWFLPSKDELHLIRTNLFQNNITEFDGGGYYWSSSTDNVFSFFAWKENFNSGVSSLETQSHLWNIRATRSF